MEKNLIEKKEKFSFRYSNLGIFLTLIIVAAIAVVSIRLLDFSSFFENKLKTKISEKVETDIRNSLYDVDDLPYYPGKILVKSDIRSYKISNYGFTDEFRKNFPNKVAIENSNGAFEIFDKENFNQMFDEDTKSSLNTFEEPKYKIVNISNGIILSEDIDPQKIEYNGILRDNKESYIQIKGFYNGDNGNIKITETKIVGEDKNNFVSYFKNNLKNIIIRTLSDISKTSGIKNLNFNYVLDFNSFEYSNEVEKSILTEIEYIKVLLISSISFIIICLVVTLTNYKKSKEVGFYKGIEKFPVEIVLILLGFWILGISISLEFLDIVLNFINLDKLLLLFMLVEFIFLFFGFIAIYYGLHVIKDLYYKGIDSFIIRNSIVCRIIYSIKRKIFIPRDILDIKNFIIVVTLLIFLGFFASINVVRSQYSVIVFILWLLLIGVGVYKFKKYYLELKNIVKITNDISDGHYEVNIDEENSSFKELSHNLNHIIDNLNKSIEKAVKSERFKTELITNVSHDLKTPLTSIINYSELIMDKNSTEEDIKKYVKVINEKSYKLKKLIEDLFEITKANTKNIQLNLEVLDLREMLNQIIGEWQENLDKKKINLVSNLEKCILKLDGQKTSRILDNLFSNIYKYTQENTRVYIDLSDSGELVIKNISNYPLNIETEDLIERFTRADTSRTTEGTGLGLSIVTSFIEIQGGSFEIQIDGDLFKTIIKFKK